MKNQKWIRWGAFYALLILWLSARSSHAIPPGFNIQGRLTDSNGINRNGVYSLKFTIYDSVIGGSNLWSKSFGSVNVQNGNFQLILADPDDTSRLLSNAFSVLAPYLEIQVVGGPGIPVPESPLVPRQALASVPYSFQSGGIVSAGPAIITSGGVEAMRATTVGVGIGTPGPLSKLDINGGVAIGSYAGVNAAPLNGLIISGNLGIGTPNPGTGFKLDVQGGDVNTSGAFRQAGTAGISASCAGGQTLSGITTAGGIVTAGSCTSNVVASYGSASTVFTGNAYLPQYPSSVGCAGPSASGLQQMSLISPLTLGMHGGKAEIGFHCDVGVSGGGGNGVHVGVTVDGNYIDGETAVHGFIESHEGAAVGVLAHNISFVHLTQNALSVGNHTFALVIYEQPNYCNLMNPDNEACEFWVRETQ